MLPNFKAVGSTEAELHLLKVEKLDACIRPLFANSVTYHVFLLPETKGSCAHMLLITACVSDYVHMHKLCRLQTEETHAKLLVKSTARDL